MSPSIHVGCNRCAIIDLWSTRSSGLSSHVLLVFVLLEPKRCVEDAFVYYLIDQLVIFLLKVYIAICSLAKSETNQEKH